MSEANPLWGAPRIHGELQRLGLEISQAAVSKYLGRRSKPPSQTWRTFLTNHIQTLVSVDFFTVPTATFKVLFVFVILAHDRRRVVHFNVTDAPTTQWTGQQLVEAFPWEMAPRYLLRDRDAVYGGVFSRRAQALGIREVKTAPRSPWQNPYVERLIGTLRRECLDHVRGGERSPPPPPAARVPRLLPRCPDPPLPRQGRPGPETGGAPRPRQDR
jgi:putative transposase